MAWLLLASAILTEIAATTALKYTNGLNIITHTTLTLLVCVLYITSYICMAQALKLQMEVSVAYAMWSGIGTAAITVIGAMLFRESMHPIKIGAIALIVVGVALLNLVPDPVAPESAAAGALTPTAILSSQAMSGPPVAVGRHRAYGGTAHLIGLAAASSGSATSAIAVPDQRTPAGSPGHVEPDRLPRHARPAWGYIQHAPPPPARQIRAGDTPRRVSDPVTSI